MQLVRSGKWLQGGLHLQHPESRVGTDEIVFKGDEKSGPWEKPWEGEGGTRDKEIGGTVSEEFDMGVRMSFKWSMKKCIMCVVGQVTCYQKSGTFNQSAFRISCLSSESAVQKHSEKESLREDVLSIGVCFGEWEELKEK